MSKNSKKLNIVETIGTPNANLLIYNINCSNYFYKELFVNMIRLKTICDGEIISKLTKALPIFEKIEFGQFVNDYEYLLLNEAKFLLFHHSTKELRFKNGNKIFCINIKEEIKTQFAILSSFGDQIFEKASKLLNQGYFVELSFLNLNSASLSFFYALIGKLYERYGNVFTERVKVVNMDSEIFKLKYQDAIYCIDNPDYVKCQNNAV